MNDAETLGDWQHRGLFVRLCELFDHDYGEPDYYNCWLGPWETGHSVRVERLICRRCGWFSHGWFELAASTEGSGVA